MSPQFSIIHMLVPAFLLCCTSTRDPESGAGMGLKDHYKDYFPIGVAVGVGSLEGESGEFIISQFSGITAENDMKIGPIHPSPGQYNWERADRIASFARENGLKLRGHTLCWHNQVPDWWYLNDQGEELTKEELLSRLRDHIFQVANRYKEVIYAWDVVNEAISDDPDEFYRDSKWYRICGEEYIQLAFEYAHEVVPDALLFYNDYDVINPVKRQKILDLIRGLKESGTPIHGIGIQGHWSIFEPDEEMLRSTIDDFARMDLNIQITELDVSVYPKEHSRRERRSDDSDVFTGVMKQQQSDQYEMIFRVFREKKDLIGAVTFWNVSDRHSWLDDFPVRGRKDYPLLFDENFQPKAAYFRVTNFDN